MSRSVTVTRRIAALHRELAEAYEQLADEEQKPRKPPRKAHVVPLEVVPSPEAVASVRRNLHRKGLS